MVGCLLASPIRKGRPLVEPCPFHTIHRSWNSHIRSLAWSFLVPAKRVLPSLGSAILIGFVFNAVAYFFLVIYSGVPAFLPLGLIPVALFDFAASSLRCVLKFTHAVLVSSSIIGLLSYATYYPFTFYLFPWSISLQLSAGAMFIGSIAGALLGQRVYDGLSSIVLGSGVP